LFVLLFLCLQIKISTAFNAFVGTLSVSNLTWRYFGPPSAIDVMIKEIHASMRATDQKLNVLLAGREPDGGKAPPKV
jgi:hypothetical protein